MSYFDYVYKKLFGARTSVLVNEVIKRSQSFLLHFNAWKASEFCEEYLNEIWQSYFWSKKGVDKDPQVMILESGQSNGFAISYEPTLNKNHFHYLFDYLADQLKKLDYRLVISKFIMKDRGEYIETREMRYLKPNNDLAVSLGHKYGNVQIEYMRINDYPTYIKFIANPPFRCDGNEYGNFEELAQYIFDKK